MNQELKDIIKQGESQHLAFKTGSPNIITLSSEVCAFANAGGGSIVIGISDDGTVQGVKYDAARFAEFEAELIKAISPNIAVSLTAIKTEGKTVLIIDVPESFDRPYTFDGKVYVRADNRTVSADGPAIKKILASSRGHESRWERQPVVGIEISDFDENEIFEMKNTLLKSGILGSSIPNNASAQELLKILNLADKGRYFNCAMTLFGKQPAKRYPQMRVRAVCYSNDEGNKLKDNRIIEGHAFKVLSDLQEFLHRHINITSEIPKRGIQRQEGPAYPMVAIREAIMNAIQHRDYEFFDGGMSVSVYPNKIEIWNSGALPVGMTVEDLKRPHYSRPHNPDIAHVFFLRGYVERIGSGIRRILEAFRAEGLPEPVWSVNSGGVNVSFTTSDLTQDVNARQQAILEKLKSGQRIALADYIRMISEKISERSARADLSELVSKGYLNKKGSARATVYERTSKGSQ